MQLYEQKSLLRPDSKPTFECDQKYAFSIKGILPRDQFFDFYRIILQGPNQ